MLPFATEAAWSTTKWDAIQRFTKLAPKDAGADFNVSVGRVLLHLRRKDYDAFGKSIDEIKEHIGASMTVDNTSSTRACHDSLLKLHALAEVEMIARMARPEHLGNDKELVNRTLGSLDFRLEAIGAYSHDKQYILGLRRAAMELSRYVRTTSHQLDSANKA